MKNRRNLTEYVRCLGKDLRVIGESLDLSSPWATTLDFFGPPSTWWKEESSELRLPQRVDEVDDWLRTMAHAALPRFFFLRASPSSLPRVEEGNPFPREAWFFVNGIGTDLAMLSRHGSLLADIFGRRCELVYNPTDGLPVDILESLLGRTFDAPSKPSRYLEERVEDALESDNYDRVVILGHSQGTIIVSNVLDRLLDTVDDLEHLRKLEVYTFAAAADEMAVHHGWSRQMGRLVPYIEHYANLDDVIARIGVLQSLDDADDAEAEDGDPDGRSDDRFHGEVYTLGKRGHLLNAHYLPEVRERKYRCDRWGVDSRLYGYLGGATPDYYNPL